MTDSSASDSRRAATAEAPDAAPAKSGSADNGSVDSAPAGSGLTKHVPAQKTPAETAPAETAPAERRPRATLSALEHADQFASRHIGPRPDDRDKMLAFLGFNTLDELAAAAVPASIATKDRLDLPPAASEAETLAELRSLASRNRRSEEHTSELQSLRHLVCR